MEDGSPYNFTNWMAGRPDNYYGVQYCGMIYAYHHFGDWDDVECFRHENAICQKKNKTTTE